MSHVLVIFKLSVDNTFAVLCKVICAETGDKRAKLIEPILNPTVDVVGVTLALHDDMEAEKTSSVLGHALSDVAKLLFCPQHIKAMIRGELDQKRVACAQILITVLAKIQQEIDG